MCETTEVYTDSVDTLAAKIQDPPACPAWAQPRVSAMAHETEDPIRSPIVSNWYSTCNWPQEGIDMYAAAMASHQNPWLDQGVGLGVLRFLGLYQPFKGIPEGNVEKHRQKFPQPYEPRSQK